MTTIRELTTERLKAALNRDKAAFAKEAKEREAAIAAQAAKAEADSIAIATSEAEASAEHADALAASLIERTIARLSGIEVGVEGESYEQREQWRTTAGVSLRSIERAISTNPIGPLWSLPGDWSDWFVHGLKYGPSELHYQAVAAVRAIALSRLSEAERAAEQAKQAARADALARLADTQMAEYEARVKQQETLEA
jgi:hypothetical protein